MAGLAVSTRFAAVFTVAALLVAAGLPSLVGAVPWVAVAVAIGGVVVLLGLVMFAGLHVCVGVDTGWLSRSGTGIGRMAYLRRRVRLVRLRRGSLPCSSPRSPSAGNGLARRNSRLLRRLRCGAGTVLVLLALSAAAMSGALARALRRLLPAAGRLSDVVLTTSGAYLVAYWLPVRLGTRCETLLSRSGDRRSSVLRPLGRFQRLVVVTAVALATALAPTGYARWRRAVLATA